MKKKLSVLIFTLLISGITVFAQTYTVSCSDFETIEDQNTWTILNGSQPNQWVFNTAARGDGTSLYISDDPYAPGIPPYEYVSTAYADENGNPVSLHANVWAYKDFQFPVCDKGFIVSFDWRCFGEDYPDPQDFMYVYIGYPEEVVAGEYGGHRSLLRLKNPLNSTRPLRFCGQREWQHFESPLPVDDNDSIIYSGHVVRLYFFWHNDNADEGIYPAAVDNVCIKSLCPLHDAINESAEIGKGEGFTLYPNPTSGIVTLQLSPEACSQSSEIQIFDIYGQRIQVMPVNSGNHQIDMSSYATGVYIIKLVSNGNVIGMQKVVRN